MNLYWYLEGHVAKPMPGDVWDSDLATRFPEKRVAHTDLGGAEISTVFLGMDHQFFDDGPPLIFETMVFSSDYPAIDEGCERYTTWDEAERGHHATVERIKAYIAEQEATDADS